MRFIRAAILTAVFTVCVLPADAFAQRRKTNPDTVAAPEAEATLAAPQSDRTGNFRFGPIGLLIGYLSGDLDFKLGDSSWTLGPTLSYWHWDWEGDGLDVKYLSYGVRANYYFGRPALTQGWYLGPYVNITSIDVKDEDRVGNSEVSASLTTTSIGAVSGYQWIWDSFNINLGIGLQASPDSKLVLRYSDGTTDSVDTRTYGLTGEFTMGWAF